MPDLVTIVIEQTGKVTVVSVPTVQPVSIYALAGGSADVLNYLQGLPGYADGKALLATATGFKWVNVIVSE